MPAPDPRANAEEVFRAISLIASPNSVVELRALNSKEGVISGYYDNLIKLAEDAAKCSEKYFAEGVYFTLNPVNPQLLGRSKNRPRTRLKSGESTTDNDIVSRRWLAIDLDPARPSGVSSTDEQHTNALTTAYDVATFLSECGFPSALVGDSGNGAHLLYRIDLPNDSTAKALVQKVLEALALRFNDGVTTIDVTCSNAARIWKMYGTPARKGESTVEQPHRLSYLLEVPDNLEVVSTDLLQRIAALAPEQPKSTNVPLNGRKPFDLEQWIGQFGLSVSSSGPWQNGHKWILNPCPWNPEHTNRAAYIVQFASGAIAAACHHNGCAGNDWKSLRRLYEPERFNSYATNGAATTNGFHAKPKKESGIMAADVTPKAGEWLWENYIPLGKLCDLQGDPGQGKSLLTAALAAIVSNGAEFPDGTAGMEGDVIMVSAEDDAADTIRPRLEAAGANLARVYLRTLADETLLTLPDDLPWLREYIEKRSVKLVILDPLDAFLSDELDANKNQSIRRLLAQLAKLAGETASSILVVRHLNKDAKTTNPMYRGGGSIGLNAASRQVLLVGASPDDPLLHALAPVKSNLGPAPASLGYRIEGIELDAHPDIKTAIIRWQGPVPLTARDLLGEPAPKPKPPPGPKVEEAKELLVAIFADGADRLASEVEEALRAQMGRISKGTLYAARKELGVKARRKGYTGPWFWVLESPEIDEKESLEPWGSETEVQTGLNVDGDDPPF